MDFAEIICNTLQLLLKQGKKTPQKEAVESRRIGWRAGIWGRLEEMRISPTAKDEQESYPI